MTDGFVITFIASIALLSAISVRFARRVALKRSLLDIPNARSSHRIPVPRLGGTAFVPLIVIAVAYLGRLYPFSNAVVMMFMMGTIGLFGISLVDDFLSLSTWLRFSVQSVAASIVLIAVWIDWPQVTDVTYDTWARVVSPPSPAFWLLLIWIVGLLNIYNFMDGIDGIAGIQAGVGGIAWYLFAIDAGAPFTAYASAAIAAGAIGFLTLNWPPAKIFMGDAGSTVIGYSFAVMPFMVAVESRTSAEFGRWLITAVLIVWPFCADGTFTILRRLKKGENIFQAHRSHLYQRLVIAGKSHRHVSLVYGGLSAVGGVFAWCVTRAMPFAILMSVVGMSGLFLALWTWTVQEERRSAQCG